MLHLFKRAFFLLIILGLLLTACSSEVTQTPEPTNIPATEAPAPTETSLPTVTPTLEPTEIPQPTDTPEPVFPATRLGGIEPSSLAQIGLAADLGVSWIRRNSLSWALVEPVQGQRNWEAVASLEAELEAAASSGMEVILIVRDTPAWAQKVPGYPCGAVLETSLEAFGQFLADAVARYSVPPYHVKYWELGNEPDVDPGLISPTMPFGCWGDGTDTYYGGGYYAEMLKVAYPRIKAANPEAIVLVGGLLLNCDPVTPPESPAGSGQFADCTPSRFLEGILEAGGGDFFDGVSFHAYDYYWNAYGQYGNGNWHSAWNTTGPVAEAKVLYLRILLASYGYNDKMILNTETALICGRDGTEPECLTDDFAMTKAHYLAQSLTIARTLGLTVNIWFNFYGWRGSGILSTDNQPLPAYTAFQVNMNQLEGAGFYLQLTEFEGVRAYEFRKPGQVIWVMWSQDGLDHLVRLPSAPQEALDVIGESLPASQELTVSLAPLYLIWETP
ncbi:MAG: hypothetical protein JW726_01225 [Anaerolineales bacterium]|nr:hypothetical protein [Anaerolineales bacterium]